MNADHARSAGGRRANGFSLIEILVVLAIFAVATAIVMPGSARMLDQTTSHAVFFEFQQQILVLRREAIRTGVPLEVVEAGERRPSSAAAGDQPSPLDPGLGAAGPIDLAAPETRRTLTLRGDWNYTLAGPIEISEGGACSPSTANLLNGDTVVMTLHSGEADCRFIRVVPRVAPQA